MEASRAIEDQLAVCERLQARIHPGFCSRYRTNNQVCHDCPQQDDMDALAKMLPDLPPVKTRGGSAQGTKEEDVSKPVRKCAACGEVKTIHGRGKCGSCYHKELREEREARPAKSPASVKDVPVERLEDEEQPRPVAYKPAEPEPLPRVDVMSEERDSAPDHASGYSGQEKFAADLDKVLGEVRFMLLSKNKAYGNAVIDPMRVFSKANKIEQINVRMDDKLSRMMRGEDAGEDPEFDLLGYLVIKRVAMLEDIQ